MRTSYIKNLVILFTIASCNTFIHAQNIDFEAYTFESGNRGYLSQVEIQILEKTSNTLKFQGISNNEGFIEFNLEKNKEYIITATKESFVDQTIEINTQGELRKNQHFIKIEMNRAPGYIFEITLAEKRKDPNTPVDALKGALIEVYNNTLKKEVIVLDDHQSPDFKVNLKKGNHYTLLIRKKGFLAKRLEVFVDVQGCILCFEGLGSIQPGITDNLSESNTMGVLLANIEMERIYTGKTMKIDNLYYELNSSTLNQAAKNQLNEVILLIKDNPDIQLELGSHTDSRGSNAYNMNLSKRRAKSAVNYIISRGRIPKGRLDYKGYGESQLVNGCSNGIDCKEEEHALNRRTELKITGVLEVDKEFISLLKLKQKDLEQELLKEILEQPQVVVKLDEEEPDFLQEKKTVEQEITDKTQDDEIKKEIEVSVGSIQSQFVDGYKIVILNSSVQLDKKHVFFERHPNLIEYFNSPDEVLYMFGDFDSKRDAKEYLSLAKKMYPNAYLILIENGIINKY